MPFQRIKVLIWGKTYPELSSKYVETVCTGGGLVAPGSIEDVRLVLRSDREKREYQQKMDEIQRQQDIFRPEYKDLEYLPYDIRLDWRCLEALNAPTDPTA